MMFRLLSSRSASRDRDSTSLVHYIPVEWHNDNAER